MPDPRPRPERTTPHRDKRCKTCGRAFSWTPALARDWDVRRHCSDTCRNTQAAAPESLLEQAILDLLAERSPGKTICPSEAAKRVAASGADGRKVPLEAWQPLMEPVRAAARRLVAQGKIVITQRGLVVNPANARGPIRLKLR